MGVMSCSRKSCENIMCDTYVDDVGYICYSCKDEFKNYLEKEQINPEFSGEISRALKLFMETAKDSYVQGYKMSVDEFFDNHTSER